MTKKTEKEILSNLEIIYPKPLLSSKDWMNVYVTGMENYIADIDDLPPSDVKDFLNKEIHQNSRRIILEDIKGKKPSKLYTDLQKVLKNEQDHLKELTPKTETQEPPQKFVKLKPIEKLLIIEYLKIDSLKRCTLGQKPGVFFLSRLLDINPESIKKPLLKLNDYTTNKLTASQAANIYPTLEKVKLFFDESELNEISKVIQIRINELKDN